MAARAGIKFTTRGAGQAIGKVKGVGSAFGGLGRNSKSASFGIGQVAYRLYNTLARVSMVRRGITGMSREVGQAESKWRGWGRAMGGPFAQVLAGASKRFAELRRTIAFYTVAVKDYFKWGKKAAGVSIGAPKKAAPAAGAPPPPTVAPPPSGIAASFGKLGGAYRMAATAAKILTVGVVALTVALTALYTFVGYKTGKMVLGVVKGFMSIRETFRKYEISLGGIIRNTKATAKIMRFATQYAAEYPAMFEDVIDAFRGLASMPTLKPMFRKADYDDLKGIMDVVQGLATLKPQQGVQGAMMALREGLSGQMRSLRMRFEVNVREMAEAAGYSFAEITHDATKALDAIRKFVEVNVPAQAMASMAKTIATQYDNLFDKYKMFVNEMMKSSGAYWAVVGALVKLNEWLTKVFAAPEIESFGQKIGNALREIVGMFETAMSGFDWRGYLQKGDIVGAVKDICNRIKTLFTVLWEEFGAEATKAVRKVAAVLWGILKPIFQMVATSFWKMLEAGAEDSARIIGKLFGAAFKGAVKAAATGIWKELTTLKIPLMGGGEKSKIEVPEAAKSGEVTVEPTGTWEEKLGQKMKAAADYLEEKAKIAAGYLKEKVGIPKIEASEIKVSKIETPKVEESFDPVKQIIMTAADYWAEKIKTAAGYLKEKTGVSGAELVKSAEPVDPLKEKLEEKAKGIREKLQVSKPEPVDVGKEIALKIDKLALANLEKQKEVKKAIANTESKIAALKRSGGENAQQLIDAEVQLLNLVIARHTAEAQLVEIAKQRKDSTRDIAELTKHGKESLSRIATLEQDILLFTDARLRTEQTMAKAGSDQNKLKKQLLKLETQIRERQEKIVELKEGNVRGTNAIIKLETEAINLAKKKIDAEQKIAQTIEKQKKTKKQILALETAIVNKKKEEVAVKTEKKAPAESRGIGWYSKPAQQSLRARIAQRFQKEYLEDYSKKQAGVSAKVGQEESKYQRRMSHFQSFAPTEMKRKEAATFLQTQESKLRGQMGGAGSLEGQKSILERLYNLNKEQYQYAKTSKGRKTEYAQATRVMEQLLRVEDAQFKENRRIAEIQGTNIENIWREVEKTNALLAMLGHADLRKVSLSMYERASVFDKNPTMFPGQGDPFA